MEKMLICPNCGAEIDINLTKCPHCGYMNLEGAKKKYYEELEQIKDNLEKVEQEPARALKKGLSRGAKVIWITLGILAAVIILFAVDLTIQLQDHPKEFLSAEEEAYASAYKFVAGKQLEEAYQNRDVAAMAQIFDRAYSEDRVSLWGDPHYETGYAASCYEKLMECLPNLEKKKLKVKEAEEITYYCFYFYYRAYGDDGEVIFDEIRDREVMPILYDRLGYTIEDMENYRMTVTSPPYVVRRKIYKIVKENYKRYH